MTNTTLARDLFPTPFQQITDRIRLRVLRFRARIRNLTRVTKCSKRRVKVAVLLLVLYTVSPLELIPDIIPGLGQLDEALALWITYRYVKRHDPAVAYALAHLFR